MSDRYTYDSDKEYKELLEPILMFPNGPDRIRIYEKCLHLAEEKKDKVRQVRYRLALIEEDEFYGSGTRIFMDYPVVLALANQVESETGGYPELSTILWDYKWLLGAASDFYQVTRQQLEMISQDMMKRYRKAGYSLRAPYEQLADFYQEIDETLSANYYKKFLLEKRDSMSDCLACERGEEVCYLLRSDEPEKALMKAQPLIEKRMTCTVEPISTLEEFVWFATMKKIKGEPVVQEIEEAIKGFADSARRAITRKQLLTTCIGRLLCYYTMYEPNKALPWIKLFPDAIEKESRPKAVFEYCIGMMLFLQGLGDRKTYKIKMDRRFCFYNDAGEYNVDEMYRYYSDTAKDVAEKFEKAQGRVAMKELFELVAGRKQ